MINAFREDYIRAIFVLCENGAGRDIPCGIRSKQLVTYLGVSKNTVSEMLSRLRLEGYVEYENYGAINLTQKGRKLARSLTAKHRLIELFLTKIFHRDPLRVHLEACALEHDFSKESLAAMKNMLGHPKFDPHGKPIYA